MRTLTVIVALALSLACTMADDSSVGVKEVSQSNAQFATDFFKKLAQENKGANVISSPLSAHTVLSMAAYGAGGNTAKQMRKALYLPSNDAVAYQGFSKFIDGFNNVKNVTLELANKIYIAQGMKLKSSYKQLTRGTFYSDTSEINTSKPQESADIVNSWVKEKTHDKIQGIVKPDDINSDTRMILLNAVYFKGKWAKEFKKEATQDRVFHLNAKTQKKVPTMFITSRFRYGQVPQLKAKWIELPYKNNQLRMLIIVPDEIEGLSNIVNNLGAFEYSKLTKDGYEQEVQLYLPKFKIEGTYDLGNLLVKLGMTDMFTNSANFRGISNEPLKVAKVVQKAYVEVNEEGSEAAAFTAIQVGVTSVRNPLVLKVDRPFIFAIINTYTKTTVFIGQVRHPKI